MVIEGAYDGDYGDVKINGQKLSPRVSQMFRNHSPDGFAWGYPGSGPAQLALAILIASGASKTVALAHYQAFKRDFIETLPHDAGFRIEVDVEAWLAAQKPAGE